MPLRKYDPIYGGKGGARKAKRAMRKRYGKKQGDSVFYATANKRRRSRL